MKKNIYTSITITSVFVIAGALSSCGAQPALDPKRPQPRVPESHVSAQNPPAPRSEAPGRPQPGAPRIPAPAVQPTSPQSPPNAGIRPPDPVSQAAPASTPSAPERRLLPSPAAPAPAGGMISLNFTRADLTEIIHIIAQHLKLTYTIDPDVKGTVTINSAEPLKPEDLLPIFHQVLRMNDAVAVRSGNLYRIVPIKDGKSIARPVGQSREDGFALQVIPVRFFTVVEMKRLLTPFLMPGGEIVENPRGNFLIIMDLPSNIQRLTEIADMIDVQVFAGTRMEIYQPKVASAEELAQEMIKIMQSFAASAPQTETFNAQFIALPRINQLLVISHSEAAWTYARRWLERIDVIAEGPGRRIFIYSVENGKATELADVLGQALGQPTSTTRSSPQTLQNLHRSTVGGTGTSTGSRSLSPTGTTGLSGGQQIPGLYATIPSPGQPATPLPAAPTPVPAPGQPRPPTTATPAAKPEEQLRIIADPGTNSLIIYGSVQEFQNIRNILKELDVIPRQVLLDLLVAEVTLGDDMRFGVDYEILRKGGDVRIFNREFGSRGGVISGITPGALSGGGVQSFPAGISGVIGTGAAVRAFINALQADSRVKVLSSPTVLATDNRPARIQVGSEEPIPTGSVTSAELTTTSTTIQYRNTGRIVTIIPQVNSQGLVHLQIKAEVSERGPDVQIGAASSGVASSSSNTFPSFTTRDAETTAVVQDGETLVIGGIITDRVSRSRTGVPYLMDIPVFGRFFGTTSDELDRTELVMLITPRVIRNRDESRTVTEDFKNKLSDVRNEIERMKRDQAKKLEKLNKRAPHQPEPIMPPPDGGKSEPQPPEGAMPPPGAPPPPEMSATEPSALFPSSKGLAPANDTMSVAPAARITNAPENFQSSPRREAGGIRTEAKPAVTPAMAASAAATRAIKESPRAAPPKVIAKEDSRLASGPVSPAVQLAKAKFDETANKAVSPPKKLWGVQVASAMREEDARTLADDLKAKGYNTNVVIAEVAGRSRYRVEVGPFENVNEAQAARKELATVHKFDDSFVIIRSTTAGSGAQKR